MPKVQTLCNFLLDKLLGVCYNGNAACDSRPRAAKNPKRKSEELTLAFFFIFFVPVFPHLHEQFTEFEKHHRTQSAYDTNEHPTDVVGDFTKQF